MRCRDAERVRRTGTRPRVELRHAGQGGSTGVLAGVALAFAARPWFEELDQQWAGGYRVFPLALAGVAAIVRLTSRLSAAIPAFVAARQDVVAALAGRRGMTSSRRPAHPLPPPIERFL